MSEDNTSTPAGSHDPLFDSAWLKLTHGLRHARTLFEDIERARQTHRPVEGVRAEYVAERGGFAIFPVTVLPAPTLWGLVLGDIAHNYRSCLDHLAWALVSRGTTPPLLLNQKAQRAIYFPFATDEAIFDKQLSSNLPGARSADVEKVRRTQPYRHREDLRERHFLTILNLINNGDKHRTLHPIWAFPTEVEVEIWSAEDCKVIETVSPPDSRPLAPAHEIAFVCAEQLGSNPRIEAHAKITTEPSIELRTGVKTWIATSAGFMSVLLNEFSAPPEDAQDMELWTWFAAHAQEDVAAT